MSNNQQQGELIHWADREATREESTKLIRDEATEIFVSGGNKIPVNDSQVESRKSRSMMEVRDLTPFG